MALVFTAYEKMMSEALKPEKHGVPTLQLTPLSFPDATLLELQQVMAALLFVHLICASQCVLRKSNELLQPLNRTKSCLSGFVREADH